MPDIFQVRRQLAQARPTSQPPGPRIHQLTGPAGDEANRLLRLLVGVELYGVERSCKLMAARIYRDRFVVGVPKDKIAGTKLEKLHAELRMPSAMWPKFESDFAASNFVYLACEADEDTCIFKAYLEFSLNLSLLHDPTIGGFRAATMARGYKWNPLEDAQVGVTEYLWQPRLSLEQLQQKLTVHQQDASLAAIAPLLERILLKGARRCDPRIWTYLEVSEPGNARLSYDLNIYPSKLVIGAVAEDLRQIAQLLGIDARQFETYLAPYRQGTLGHMSAGIDRAGRPFFTFYFDPAGPN